MLTGDLLLCHHQKLIFTKMFFITSTKLNDYFAIARDLEYLFYKFRNCSNLYNLQPFVRLALRFVESGNKNLFHTQLCSLCNPFFYLAYRAYLTAEANFTCKSITGRDAFIKI